MNDLAAAQPRSEGLASAADKPGQVLRSEPGRVAQPKYAWWFADGGWTAENHGVDPDVEVTIAPHDWAAGRDPQLDTAVRLALQALEQRTPAAPPTI